MVPIYGKLSDLLGRKPIFLFGVVVFLAGSALSGTAQSMNQLILFRAFQGIGAGALIPIAITIVGDLFTPRERGKWQGLTGGIWGLSAIVGPTLGGWITQNTTWRWIFYVNLPIGIAALLVLGTVPLLLGFTWAGSQYDWLSPQIIGLFAGALVALTAFVFYEARLERRGGQPIIEPGLFKNSVFTVMHVMPAQFLAAFNNPQILLSPTALAQIQSHVAAMGPQALALLHQTVEAVKVGLTQGIHNVFVLSCGLMTAGLVAVLFLKEIPLKGGRSTGRKNTESVKDEASQP